jgi:hypothetical protein
VTASFDQRGFPLSVGKTGSGTGTVTSDPAGIDCGAICSAGFAADTMVTLTPVATGGSAFTGWAGACTGTATCVVTMSMARMVTANFGPATAVLTVTKNGGGAGVVTSNPTGLTCGPTCSATFSTGTPITLTAMADPGSAFVSWSGGGCSGGGACVVSLSGPTTVTAFFNSTIPPTETLVTGLSSGFEVSPQADGFVYFTQQGAFMQNTGTVGKVAKTGGGVTNLATGQMNPFDMIVAGSWVYWADVREGAGKRVPTVGGALALLGRLPTQMASDGTDVYWTESGSISKVPVGTNGPITDVITGLANAYGIYVDATNIYWVERSPTTSTVKKRPKAGGTITVLAANLPLIDRVASDGTHLYGVVYAMGVNDGAIVRVPLAGGAFETVAAGINPFDVAVDGTHVYWTGWLNSPTGVFRCIKGANCTVEPVSTTGSAFGIGLDGTHVYWSENDSVKRRAK